MSYRIQPRQVGPLKWGSASSLTSIVFIDVKSTSPTYYNDGTVNVEGRPYFISLLSAVLSQDNALIPVDRLSFRIAVDGHLLLNEPLPELMEQLKGIASPFVDLATKERARLQVHAQNDVTELPSVTKTLQEYEFKPNVVNDGLDPDSAKEVIIKYLSRFQSAIIIGEDLRHALTMLDRIGVAIEAIPQVYTRMIDTQSVMFMVALSSGQGLSIPRIKEAYPAVSSSPDDRTQFLLSLFGSMTAVEEPEPVFYYETVGEMTVIANAGFGILKGTITYMIGETTISEEIELQASEEYVIHGLIDTVEFVPETT